MSIFTATFRRYTSDTSNDPIERELIARNGQRVEILGELDRDTYDFADTGVIHRVIFEDGYDADAFGEELTEWREKGA